MTYVKPLDIPVKNKVLPSLLTAMLLALPGIIKAQVDLTEMPKKTGVWKYVYEKTAYENAFSMSASETTIFHNKPKTIAEQLHRHPLLLNPLGTKDQQRQALNLLELLIN